MIIGTGYVGLVQGVCLAELGHNVVCIDLDQAKIDLLNSGIPTIHEKNLAKLLKKNLKTKRLTFGTNLKDHIKNQEIIFIAVGTPPDEDGKADLKHVLHAAKEIGQALSLEKPSKSLIVVNKSTVPVGTGKLVKEETAKYFKGSFSVISNPEFLREGWAINDFFNPDRVIIGAEQKDLKASKKLAKIYSFTNSPVLITSLEAAEIIKYASNAFLATQISFINSLAELCEKVGANIDEISQGMKLDQRIGKKALFNAGVGYGGSCLPKDVKALIKTASQYEVDFRILKQVDLVNLAQRQKFVKQINKKIVKLKNKKIAVWGLAFKRDTDDVRESPAITIIEELVSSGAKINAYDPAANHNFLQVVPQVTTFNDMYECLKDTDALVVLTDWDQFKKADLTKIKHFLKNPLIFDGRNIFNPTKMQKLGFEYYSVGRR